MSLKTKILGLFKYDPDKDGASTFNIKQALNDNWDTLDAEVGARVKSAELAAKVRESVKSGGLTAADLGADPTGAAADEVSAHDAAADAHSALFAKKQNKIKGTKGKYLGFTANDTVGEVDAPASGGSRITLTFASDFVGQAWTLSGGGETYTGTVDTSLTASVSVLGINTSYTLSCVLDGVTYMNEVATKEYYTALSVRLTTFRATITVTVDSGSTVTCALGDTTYTKVSDGTAVFDVFKAGTWTITAKIRKLTAFGTVEITASGENKTLELDYANVFGVMWDTSNSSTALTRLTPDTDPYGYVSKSVTTEPKPAVGTGSGSSPFDAFMPWSGMKECNITTGGYVFAWKGDASFSRSNHNTMVFVPEFYVLFKENGAKKYFYVSDEMISGFKKHPGSGKYVGRYQAFNYDVNDIDMESRTGYLPWTGGVFTTYRQGATRYSNFHMYDFVTYCAIAWLYLIEFADWNCQRKIGLGYTSVGNSPLKNGETDSMVFHTGRASGTDGVTAVQYRWIENLWGNISQWIDGVTVADKIVYYCTDPSKYVCGNITNYTRIGALPEGGYIKDLTVTEDGLFIPKTSGGSGSTYIPDSVGSRDGMYEVYCGGNHGVGESAGLMYFDARLSGDNSGFTARLMFDPSL